MSDADNRPPPIHLDGHWPGGGPAPAGLRARGPNNRIGLGIIGCGSRGNYLLGKTFPPPQTASRNRRPR